MERRNGSAVVEIPESELDIGSIESGDVYRVAILPGVDTGRRDTTRSAESRRGEQAGPRSPPVAEGDVREVEIEGIGDQGDGIAKVDRGFVVIVPETSPGDQVAVEIQSVYDNFALGSIVEDVEDWKDRPS